MKNFKADVSNTSPLSFALTLWRKARNVSFETLYGGQFILSTQLIKKLKNYLWQVLIYPPGGGGGFWSSNSKNFTWSPHKAHLYSNNLSSPSYAVNRKSIFYTSPIMLYWQKTIPILSPLKIMWSSNKSSTTQPPPWAKNIDLSVIRADDFKGRIRTWFAVV